MRMTAATDIGLQRTENQDEYAGGKIREGVYWAVVCDGMGGSACGDQASNTAIVSMEESLTKDLAALADSKGVKQLLVQAVQKANTAVYQKACGDDETRGMGTTVVALVAFEDEVFVAHVGDSRAYLLRRDRFTAITKDHSVVQELLEKGEISPEEAMRHPRRNLITRALGIAATVQVTTAQLDMKKGDLFLLCSDGISACLAPEEIKNILLTNRFFHRPGALIQAVLEKQCTDNITALLLQNTSEEEDEGELES